MLSDAHIDAANRAILKVFETTSLAWRTIPHWLTGDPGRSAIRSDSWFSYQDPPGPGIGEPLAEGPYGGPAVAITDLSRRLNVTHAAATAATPDQVASAASAAAVALVREFDDAVAIGLATPVVANGAAQGIAPGVFQDEDGEPKVPSTDLLDARDQVETAGYLGSRSVWAGGDFFAAFHQTIGTRLILGACAEVLQAGSLYRWSPNVDPAVISIERDNKPVAYQIATTMVVIGRRQEIAPGRAFEAPAGQEPIDLAVAVAPSLELVGDNPAGDIELAVRIRYALRFKDHRAVVVWTTEG